MIVTIRPSSLTGNIWAPASKSSMQRACAAALVKKGISIIHNPGTSNDDQAALKIIQKLGAEVQKKDEDLIVKSEGVNPVISTSGSGNINCGESGLSIRMFTPLVSLSDKSMVIDGEGSLLKRPMDFFDEVLPQLGVEVISNKGMLPLHVKGPLRPQNILIDGTLSSQFLTGLLMAYSAAEATDVAINVIDLKSKPYVDLTLKVMSDFGLNIPENRNYEKFVFHGSQQSKPLHQIEYTVEGDWSGAAFLLVAGAIAGNISVKGLDIQSTQADKKILEALQDSGCILSISDTSINVAFPPLGLKGFHFNATDCPDLFPPLVALASYCKGTTVIEGVTRLKHKESDRGITLQEEFAKMGVTVKLQDDLMFIESANLPKGAMVHSRSDHRIAMACAVAALKAEGKTVIEEAQAINKSYPDFYRHLQSLGASVSL